MSRKKTSSVPSYTQDARNGIFRYFPGADNRNAKQTNCHRRSQGNPIRNGVPVRRVDQSVFRRDAKRTGYDPSGYIQKVILLARMPLPNDFTVGDGLNTAGIRFIRRSTAWTSTPVKHTTPITATSSTAPGSQLQCRQQAQFCLHLRYSIQHHHDGRHSTLAGRLRWRERKRPQLYSVSLVSTLGATR